MSKVFKSSRVTVDKDRKVTIDVAPVLPEVSGGFEEKSIVKLELVDSFEEDEQISAEDIINEARGEAARIIDEATIEADEIISNVRQLAAAEREEAARTGYDEGYTEGHSKGRIEAEGMRGEAQKIIDQAYVLKDEIIAQAEPEIIELVINIVEKLLHNEAEFNPKVIVPLVKSGLARMSLNGNVNIRVSKEDYDALIENKDEVLAAVEGYANIEFSQDLALSKSSCIIDTEFGSVDCGLDSQYKELVKSLKFLLKNR